MKTSLITFLRHGGPVPVRRSATFGLRRALGWARRPEVFRGSLRPLGLALLLVLAAPIARAQFTADSQTNTITSATSTNWSPADYVVGSNNVFDVLQVNGGGALANVNGYLGFTSTASNNLAVVSGSGSVWSNANLLLVGYQSSGNQLIITNVGKVVNGEGDLGYTASSGNNLVLVSGSGSAWNNTNTLNVGRSGSGNQLIVSNGGNVAVSGSSTISLGYQAGSTNNQLTLVNGGTLQSGFSVIGYNGGGNTALVSGTGSVWTAGFVRLGESAGSSFNRLIITNGGKVIQGPAGNNSIVGTSSSNNWALVSGNGTVWSNAAPLYVDGGGGVNARNNQLVINDGGTVFAASSMNVGQQGGNNTVRIESGGILDANTLVLNALAGSANNSITNFGGIFQFSSATPTITPHAERGGSIVLTNGTIAFRNLGTADVRGNWSGSDLTNITFQGANTFRLNSASNTTSGQDYIFNTGLGATNYVALEMINGATAWRGGSLTIGAGGTMFVSNTAATVAGVFTNSGGVRVVQAQLAFSTNVVINGGSLFSLDATSMFTALGNYGSQGGGLTNANGVVSFTVVGGTNVAVISGSGSVWNGGTNLLYVGSLSAGNQLIITNAGQVVSGSIDMGRALASSNNLALVSGGGSVWQATGDFGLGRASGGNELTVSNGGSVSIGGLLDMSVSTGGGGNNRLRILDGGIVASTNAYIGDNTTSGNNLVLVSGSGSVWSNASGVLVGYRSSGNQLIITNGGRVVSKDNDMGYTYQSANNLELVSGSGSVWQASGYIHVGRAAGGNELTVSNGGSVSAAGELSLGSYYGGYANNRLRIVEGGSVTSGNGYVGQLGGNSNLVLVSGTGSLWTVNGYLHLGDATNSAGNQLIVTNSGKVFVSGSLVAGDASSGSGAVVLDSGGSLSTGAGVQLGTVTTSTGTVSVAGGATLTANNSVDNFKIGAGGVGSLTVSNGGTVLVSNGYLRVGETSLGQLTVAGGNVWARGAGLMVGTVAGGTGNVEVSSGSVMATNGGGYGYVGYWGSGNLTVNTQGVVTVNNMFVGAGGTGGVGMVSIDHGGQVFALASLAAGGASNATGTVVLNNGGLLSLSGGFTLGSAANGVGTALVAGGATLAARNSGDLFKIGDGGVGSLTVSNGGSVLVSNGYLRVGQTSLGQLTVAGGSVWMGGAGLMVGTVAGGTGNVLVTGGSVTANAGTGYVGYEGVGNLTVSNQGVVTVISLRLGEGAGGAGAVSIDRGGRMTVGTSGLFAGNGNGATGSVLVANGGVLEVGGGITLGAGTGSWGTITNQNGGILRFTGVNTLSPFMTLTRGSVVVTNATIEFANNGTAAVDVLGNSTNITIQADSQLNLNNSWNLGGLGGYSVGTGSTFARLGLVNTGYWQSVSLTIGTGGALQVTNGGWVTATVTNQGAITVLNGPVYFWNNVLLGGGSSYLSQGGNNIFSNGLTIASGASFVADAASQVSVVGTYQNLGSSWFSNLYSIVSGGAYRSSGATNTFAGGLNIASGGRFDVTNGQSVIGGTITNAGTMTVFNAQAIYNGNVVNQGAYVSDPSTNTFNGNFTVGPTATVVAAAGDVYAFGSNFVMQSTNRAFSMSTAIAYFGDTNYGITTGNTNHTLNIGGSGAMDLGHFTSFSMVSSNFAIGTLSIAPSNRLTLTGTKSGATTNALYVGWLDIQGLTTGSTNSYLAVSNTLVLALSLPDVNLYYNVYDSRNNWLTEWLPSLVPGTGYDLWNGGLLLPIPEPSTILAAGAGLVLLAFLRRRRG